MTAPLGLVRGPTRRAERRRCRFRSTAWRRSAHPRRRLVGRWSTCRPRRPSRRRVRSGRRRRPCAARTCRAVSAAVARRIRTARRCPLRVRCGRRRRSPSTCRRGWLGGKQPGQQPARGRAVRGRRRARQCRGRRCSVRGDTETPPAPVVVRDGADLGLQEVPGEQQHLLVVLGQQLLVAVEITQQGREGPVLDDGHDVAPPFNSASGVGIARCL